MKVKFSRRFTKDFARISLKIKKAFEIRLKIFIQNPYGQILNNHGLIGRWQGYRSINVTGDVRAIYRALNEDVMEFVTIGTHSQLYG